MFLVAVVQEMGVERQKMSHLITLQPYVRTQFASFSEMRVFGSYLFNFLPIYQYTRNIIIIIRNNLTEFTQNVCADFWEEQ